MMDFASRASWCVAESYEDGNHAPQVSIAEGLDRTAVPGQTVTLRAQASDHDGDEVRLSWMRYADADSCAGEVSLEATGDVCTLRVPEDAMPGDTIHVICRATDEGNGRDTFMVNYARVIVTVSAA